jgi:hypothetical protein
MKEKFSIVIIILLTTIGCSKTNYETNPATQPIQSLQCSKPQVIEKTIEIPKIITKIIVKEKIVIKEVVKEVIKEKIIYVEKGSPESVNNIFSAYASYGPSGNLLDQQYGGIDYAVAEKNTTVGFQYQRRVLDKCMGFSWCRSSRKF